MNRRNRRKCLLASAVVALLIAACGKPTRPVTETELIGKWTTVEVITHRGNRGPAKGIMEARIEFFTNHTSTGMFKWSEPYITNAEALAPRSFSGRWELKGDILHAQVGTNPPSRARLWFENDLLVQEPTERKPNTASITTILERGE